MFLYFSLQIIENSSNDDGLNGSCKPLKHSELLSSTAIGSPSKSNSNQNNQKTIKQESLPTTPLSFHQSHKQLQNIKISPSRSMSTNLTSISPNSNQNKKQTDSTQQLILPSKDSVIKKMKKITKAVQELFKATKQSDFSS